MRYFAYIFTALMAFGVGTLSVAAENDLAPIKAEIAKRHDEAVKRLQDWIHQVSIAAQDRGYPEEAANNCRRVIFEVSRRD